MQNATQQNRVPAAQPRQELRQTQQNGQIPQPQNARKQPAQQQQAQQYQQVRRPVQQTQQDYYPDAPVNETFFEEDEEMEYMQQPPQYGRGQPYAEVPPVIVQGYNKDQIEILRSVESVQMVILNDPDMPEYQKERLLRAILYLLTLGNMTELIGNYIVIPKDPVASEQVQKQAQATQEPVHNIPDDDAAFIEPDQVSGSKEDLDIISQRLNDLNEGVMNAPQEPAPTEEKKGLIGRILSGGKKIYRIKP